MSNPKENDKSKKIRIPTREPKKRTSGIFDNLRQLPHPIEEILGLETASVVQTESDMTQLPSSPVTESPGYSEFRLEPQIIPGSELISDLPKIEDLPQIESLTPLLSNPDIESPGYSNPA